MKLNRSIVSTSTYGRKRYPVMLITIKDINSLEKYLKKLIMKKIIRKIMNALLPVRIPAPKITIIFK